MSLWETLIHQLTLSSLAVEGVIMAALSSSQGSEEDHLRILRMTCQTTIINPTCSKKCRASNSPLPRTSNIPSSYGNILKSLLALVQSTKDCQFI